MIRKKKGIKALALGLVITVLSCSFAFADTKSIPMSLTIKAKVIDVLVPEKIVMSAEAGKAAMSVDDITVTNNASSNSLYLLTVSYGGDISPWTLVADDTDFVTMKKDQHKYSLTADGADLKAGEKEYTSNEISASSSYTVVMEGKTGIVTEAVAEQQAGTIVLTVGLK